LVLGFHGNYYIFKKRVNKIIEPNIEKQSKCILTSGECLQISLKAEAAILFKSNSGSCIHNTSKGTAPASTTACELSFNCQNT